MEKRLLLFMFLAFLFMYVSFSMFGQQKPAPEKDGKEPGTEGEAEPGGPAEQPGEPSTEPEAPPAAAEGLERRFSDEGKTREVDTKRIRWTLSTWGGSVREARLKEFAEEPGQDLDDEESWYRALCRVGEHTNRRNLARQRGALTIEVVKPDGAVDDPATLPLHEVLWQDVTPKDAKNKVIYRKAIEAAGVVFEKEFTFPESVEGVEGGPYNLDLVLRMKVVDQARAKRFGQDGWRIRLTGPAGVPAERWHSGPPVIGAAITVDSVSVKEFDAPGRAWKRTEDREDWPDIEKWPEDGDRSGERAVKWLGIHNRFFGAILRPKDPKSLGASQAVFYPISEWMRDGEKEEYANWAAVLDFTLPLPASGGEVERKFDFFVGPIDPDLFSTAAYANLKPIIDYGLFGFISKAIVFILGGIQSLVGNWGVAIIILTLLIRMAMFPLSRKSQLAMQNYSRQMARLKPKVDQLKQRYSKNRKKMNEEMMKLYREEGVRMVPAGCLIMFLQLPIFIGLFQALRYSVGLRHAAFLWAPDLTAPDRLAGPIATGSIPLIPDPFYLNVFPILMGVTWFLSSAMAPKPVDPQQQSTMKMMKWMPIIFSLLLYNYAAGLALYMVVSSTWSIFETKVVKKVFLKEKGEVAPVGAGPQFRKGK